jgi:hypothetical protein
MIDVSLANNKFIMCVLHAEGVRPNASAKTSGARAKSEELISGKRAFYGRRGA